MLTDVGPVELWATRWRRPSAAANPQGFCGPATPRLTHFVTRVMLIRLIDWPGEENRPEQIRLGSRGQLWAAFFLSRLPAAGLFISVSSPVSLTSPIRAFLRA